MTDDRVPIEGLTGPAGWPINHFLIAIARSLRGRALATCVKNLRPLGRSDWGMLQNWPGPASELASRFAGFQQFCCVIVHPRALLTLLHPHTQSHTPLTQRISRFSARVPSMADEAVDTASNIGKLEASQLGSTNFYHSTVYRRHQSRLCANRYFLLLEGPRSLKLLRKIR